jgi:NAD(P)-dependent dehydrogenase (short-subunit alcohol dehydrogenase family)
MEMNLGNERKTVLVTGGAHRVGRAISLAFASAGTNVVVNYHSSSAEAISTSAEIERMGVGALPFKADVSDPDQVQAMVAAANDCFGGVDILVNSASIFVETPIPTKNFDLWHKVTNILLDAHFIVRMLWRLICWKVVQGPLSLLLISVPGNPGRALLPIR